MTTDHSFTVPKTQVTHAPDFTGLDPDTLEPWSPVKVARHLGLRAINDPQEIEALCQKVLDENPDQVSAYRAGKVRVLGFIVKKVMDASRNGANAEVTQATLLRLLG